MNHFKLHEVEFGDGPELLRVGEGFPEVFGGTNRGLVCEVNSYTGGQVGWVNSFP